MRQTWLRNVFSHLQPKVPRNQFPQNLTQKIDQQIFIHNFWEEEKIDTVSLYLPVPIYNSDKPNESPEFLMVKQLLWSYQNQIWLSAKRNRLLGSLTSLHQSRKRN